MSIFRNMLADQLRAEGIPHAAPSAAINDKRAMEDQRAARTPDEFWILGDEVGPAVPPVEVNANVDEVMQ